MSDRLTTLTQKDVRTILGTVIGGIVGCGMASAEDVRGAVKSWASDDATWRQMESIRALAKNGGFIPPVEDA